MATMLPRTLLALCLLFSACEEKKTPLVIDERAVKFKALIKEAKIKAEKSADPEAKDAYRKALALCDKTANASEWADTARALALLYQNAQEIEKAETLYREILAQNEEHFGKDSPESAQTLGCLAYVVQKRGDGAESEILLRREVAVREAILGKNDSAKRWLGTDSQLLGESLWRLGALLEESGRLAEAGPILGRALKTLIDTSKKLEYLHEEVERLVKHYRNLLLKMGDTEEQAQEKIDKMMEPLTKK